MATLRFDYGQGWVFAELPNMLKQAALDELEHIADDAVFIAKSICPVDTGSLRDSIRRERVGNSVRIVAGGSVVNPKTGRPVDYAVYVEVKQPFLRPALEFIRSVMAERVGKAILERCQP